MECTHKHRLMCICLAAGCSVQQNKLTSLLFFSNMTTGQNITYGKDTLAQWSCQTQVSSSRWSQLVLVGSVCPVPSVPVGLVRPQSDKAKELEC